MCSLVAACVLALIKINGKQTVKVCDANEVPHSFLARETTKTLP
jgi:hypothetical protein